MRTRIAMMTCSTFVLLAFAACGDDAPPPLASGPELFEREACTRCHGKNGEGAGLGPTLHGKKVHWTRESLVAYLKDPVGYAKKDPRLAVQGQKFLQPMPTYKLLRPEELERLADHVLAMP